MQTSSTMCCDRSFYLVTVCSQYFVQLLLSHWNNLCAAAALASHNTPITSSLFNGGKSFLHNSWCPQHTICVTHFISLKSNNTVISLRNQHCTFPKHAFSNQTVVRGSEGNLAQAWCPCLTFWCHDRRLVWALPVAPSHDALLVGVLSLCSLYLHDLPMKTSPLASQRVETG